MQIKIREPHEQEWENLLAIGLEFAYSSGYREIKLDLEKAKKVWFGWYRSSNHYIRVATYDDKPVALFAGYLGTYWFSRELRGQELLFFVLPEYRGHGIGKKLLTGFIEWCRENGASRRYLFNSSGISAAADELYESVGGIRQGGFYVHED